MPKPPAVMQERLKKIRSELNLSQRDFAGRIYISQSLYAELEIGKRTVNERIIHLISTQFNVSKKYLREGAGEIFTAEQPDLKLDQLITIFNSLDNLLQDYLLLQAREILKIQKTGVKKK